MKKKLIALLAGALMTVAMAGNAFAAFEELHLIRFVYGASNEVATDLGSVTSLVANGGTGLGSGANAWNATYGTKTVGTTGLYVGYAAYDLNTGDLYISAQSGLGTITPYDLANLGSTLAGLQGIMNNYAKEGSNSSYLLGKTGAGDTYFNVMDQGQDGSGGFAAFFDSQMYPGGTMSLSGAATQGLYLLDADGVNSDYNFHQVATIITNADGSTSVERMDSSQVPLPAAAYLLGSGLLGLVGIRRRMNK